MRPRPLAERTRKFSKKKRRRNNSTHNESYANLRKRNLRKITTIRKLLAEPLAADFTDANKLAIPRLVHYNY